MLALLTAGCPQDIGVQGPPPIARRDAAPSADAAADADAGDAGDASVLDSGPAVTCGNGSVDVDEVCDPAGPAADCSTLSLGMGSLGCASDCRTHDTSGCGICRQACAGRTCGPNPRCSSTCGTCTAPQLCTTIGTCHTACVEGSAECSADGFGFHGCGDNPAIGARDLGPRVPCGPGDRCEGGACVRARCLNAEVELIVDRSVGAGVGSAWSWVRTALLETVADRQYNNQFGLRQLPNAPCQSALAVPLSMAAHGAVSAGLTAPGNEASRPIAGALAAARADFASPRDGSAVILVLAGQETCDAAADALTQASLLYRSGVRVYVIAVSTAVDDATIDAIAAAGGTVSGRRADSAPALGASLVAVLDDLDACANPTPMVTAGFYHSCAIGSDRTLRCWGRNLDGQSTPPPGQYSHVAASTDNVCAVATDGALTCWGRSDAGQNLYPAGSFTQVAGGDSHVCALRTDGTAACWGNDDSRQAQPPATVFKQVTAGGFYACGILEDDTVDCWGSATPAPSGTFRQIDGGSFHLCGVRTDGTLFCRGSNGFGESSPPAGQFVQVSAGSDHSCAVKADQTIECWGQSVYGALDVPPGAYLQVDVNNAHSCAVRVDGGIACWGTGGDGQATPPP